jgi:hypothetical protein
MMTVECGTQESWKKADESESGTSVLLRLRLARVLREIAEPGEVRSARRKSGSFPAFLSSTLIKLAVCAYEEGMWNSGKLEKGG